MGQDTSESTARQFHLKLTEWAKLNRLIEFAQARLRALPGMGRAKASQNLAVDMAIDMAHAVLTNPDLVVVSESAMLQELNEHHLKTVERVILTMFGPDYKNLRLKREADGSLSGAHDGQKAAAGKSAIFKYPAQIFGADRGKAGIKELLNKGRPSTPMVE